MLRHALVKAEVDSLKEMLPWIRNDDGARLRLQANQFVPAIKAIFKGEKLIQALSGAVTCLTSPVIGVAGGRVFHDQNSLKYLASAVEGDPKAWPQCDPVLPVCSLCVQCSSGRIHVVATPTA